MSATLDAFDLTRASFTDADIIALSVDYILRVRSGNVSGARSITRYLRNVDTVQGTSHLERFVHCVETHTACLLARAGGDS